ncbi:dihydrofolate reductase family protein [Myceligenerans crystallogenes]|uniref:Dihydrofolate reductase family protein n=1 Tax=Myceligenerans crystallogenes TaxID=316335 RepID=A0ABN2N7W6_9MICO
MTLDLYGTGLRQGREDPFGFDGAGDPVGERLHPWMFEHGDAHKAEVDAIVDAGAFVMGRNMFTPGRGEWDLDWKGWWGPEPPYHGPVFVLTHHPREPLEMDGGTTFHFVTDGSEAALARAREAAGDRNVSIAGGVAVLNQYLALGVVDELRLHVVPFTLGAGERVFDGVPPSSLRLVSARHTPEVTHLTYSQRSAA